MDRRNPSSPARKKFKTTPSAGKVLLAVFWDAQGVSLLNFLEVVDDAATQEEEDNSQTIGSTSVRHIGVSIDQPRSTVHKALRKVLHYYPY
ncbi:hypothetical protein TNCV_2867111 [Trichonephila clavipes]|nr:hypothetical protein TNCV_2867111 [Trichonephila clavipes]